ncbi:chalcone isomerase [Artemisia annua]|uniref:Chalcone isomerase n=1 Tax=Artemisia annua TaxID=35608 RepID=A0A2U1NFG5_ARTAN|nr:chalcone isomerase [Artemisia annua]
MNADTSTTRNAENEIHEEKLQNEDMLIEVERKTGISFPVKLSDGKKLIGVGLRRKNFLGLSFRVYSFGIYADKEKLTGVLRSKIVNTPTKGTDEIYKMVIDNTVGVTVKMVIVVSNLSMNMVRKNFNDSVVAAIVELGGGKNNELTKRIMEEAKDDLKLTRGSEIEITCLPGCILETKVHGKVVNKLESEMLCRAFIYLYLGDDPLDKEAKEKFGMFMLSLIGDRH